MLLDQWEEVWQAFRVGCNNRFSEKRSDFGPADVECVTEACNVLESDVCSGGGQSVSQACSVHIKRNMSFAAYAAQILQFIERIKCAVFGGMGDVDHSRGNHVLIGFVAVEVGDVGFHLVSP